MEEGLKQICLNENYCTTRLLFDKKVDFVKPLNSKIDFIDRLPKIKGRIDEGGLRLQNYYKYSIDRGYTGFLLKNNLPVELLPKEKSNISGFPLITVVTIIFNGEKEIEETIQSVLKQTYSNIEFIIIDGGSKDATINYIKKYNDSIDYWVSEKDKGISDAFNKGIQLMRGDWCIFMNAGDVFDNEKVISSITESLDQSLDLVYGHIRMVDEHGNILRKFGKPFSKNKFLRSMIVPHQAAFHNIKLFQEIGGYSDDFIYTMDFELLLRKPDSKIKYIDLIVARMLEGGVSRTNVNGVYKEYFKAKQKHNIKNYFSNKLDYYEEHLRYQFSKFLKKKQ